MQSMAYNYQQLYLFKPGPPEGQDRGSYVRTWVKSDRLFCSVVNMSRSAQRSENGIESTRTVMIITNTTQALIEEGDRMGAEVPEYEIMSVRTYQTGQQAEARKCR